MDASGWSQARCAEAIGVSRQHLNALLQGKKEVSRDRVDLLKYRLLDQQPGSVGARVEVLRDRSVPYHGESERLAKMLERLRVVDPGSYAAAKAIVERLGALANSKMDQEDAGALAREAASNLPERSPQDEPTIGQKGEPSAGVFPHPKTRPPRPTEDQS